MPTAYLSPSQLQGLTDVSVNPGSGENGYPLVWNNISARWEASNNIAGVTVRAGAGANSVAIGSTSNSSGSNWIAFGINTGRDNTGGNNWIAEGPNAARQGTTSGDFIAQGLNAGRDCTINSNWMAQGAYAAQRSTGGINFIAQGGSSAANNILGSDFIAQGVNTGLDTTGSSWIAQGNNSARANTGGSNFLSQGRDSGRFNTLGSGWTAQGFEAGYWDNRSNVLNIANSRSKSLICGNFAGNCIYFGHPGGAPAGAYSSATAGYGDAIASSATVPVPTAAVHAAASNTTRASLRIDSGVAPTTPNTGDIWVNSSNNSLNFQIPLVNLQGTQVLATRRTGWAAPTGTATRTSFDTATATTTQLAERLKALIDDLTTHGLIGT